MFLNFGCPHSFVSALLGSAPLGAQRIRTMFVSALLGSAPFGCRTFGSAPLGAAPRCGNFVIIKPRSEILIKPIIVFCIFHFYLLFRGFTVF